ncbi:hypothetical protein GCM10028808_37130 [Spirosoma migulaei]
MGSFEEMVQWGSTKKNININLNTTWDYDNNGFNPFIGGEDKRYTKTEWKINPNNSLPTLDHISLSDLVGNSVEIHDLGKESYSLQTSLLTIPKDGIYNTENYKYESLEELRYGYNWKGDINELLNNEYYQKFVGASFNYIGAFREAPLRTYYQKPKPGRVSTEGSGYIDQIVEWEEANSQEFDMLVESLQDLELLNALQTSKLKGGRFDLNVKINKNASFASLTDVGFGVSQFLPIIVADLQLSQYSCLAISQPEIHLHPKIQAQFGNYLANKINQTKKQYIVETHSEYLLNRIRLLLVTGELKPEDVCVLYFENDGIKSTVHDVEFTTKGAVKGAPQGFFDTYEMDVMDIAMHAIG